jgi:hypothetical protein
MYVAVCVSGVPRNSYYPRWIGKLGERYNTKVFINYWQPHDDFLVHSNTPAPRNGYVLDESIYKYPNSETFFTVNDWNYMKPEFQKIFDQIPVGARIRNDLGVISMFYGIYRAQLMAEEYEKQNNIRFGIVFRTRMDTYVKVGKWDYDLTKFDVNSTLYHPDYNVNYCNDHWGFSNGDIMEKYGRVYENILPLVNKVAYYPERMVVEQLGPEVELKMVDFVGLPRFIGGEGE